MKTITKILLAFVALVVVTEVHAMRWYSPSTGKWLSRDPIGEDFGVNLTGFVNNDSINHWDHLGLAIRPNPKCNHYCKTDKDCCRCMVFCEGEGNCEPVVYLVMKNRQRTKWGDFSGETDFCAQARSTKFDCGPKGKILINGKPGGGRDRYDQCCTRTLPSGRSSDGAEATCNNDWNPGTDFTGGAQFFFTAGAAPKWMKYNVQIGNCTKVDVSGVGCKLDVYKCKNPPKPAPPGY